MVLLLVALACGAKRVMLPPPARMQTFLAQKRVLPKQEIGSDLPASFDVRTAFPGCAHAILDQGQCNSCWAFASTESLGDRFCIASQGRINVALSPQNALQCETLHWGCSMGSMPEWAWPFLTSHGAASLSCMPYISANGSVPHGCQTRCTDGSAPRYYKAASWAHAGDFFDASHHVDAIMRALLSGPLDATFVVHGDFDSYQPGTVYRHKSGGLEGLHSVKIVGWGEQNGELFWTVANSWGAGWGDHGYFKIARGVDECMFESQVFYGVPAL